MKTTLFTLREVWKALGVFYSRFYRPNGFRAPIMQGLDATKITARRACMCEPHQPAVGCPKHPVEV